MAKIIKIGIAEDHDLVRQGLVNLLMGEENIRVVFDVPDGMELLSTLKNKKIDVLLLDLNMPILDGNQALKVIKDKYSQLKVIIISMYYDVEFITDAIANGAKGFLPKNCDFEKLLDAISSVQEKGYYFDDKVTSALVSRVLMNQQGNNESANCITQREVEIIGCVCRGMKNKEIAEKLYLSIRTVEGHRQRISEKTNTTSIADLVIYAIKNGIFEI